MRDKLRAKAKEIGIDLIGYTDSSKFNEVKAVLVKRMDKGYNCPFFKYSEEKNTDPLYVWEETKSIISIGLAYKSHLPKYSGSSERAKLSRVAWGKDYHMVLMDRMDELMDYALKEYPSLKYKAYVDNAPLLDREVAFRSGIGYYGKNGFIMNDLYGSYLFLGHILVNISLEASKLCPSSSCKDCSKCIEACPTKALEEDYQFNANKCISYISQKKDMLSKWQRKALGKNIYGCDICQEVCPINKGAKYSNHIDFQPQIELVRPKLEWLINMDKASFEKTYGLTAAGWRGRKTLQRNAVIVAGNVKSEANFKLLKSTLKDMRWEIRLYSMFSLLEYGKEGREAVDEAIQKETPEFIEKFNTFK